MKAAQSYDLTNKYNSQSLYIFPTVQKLIFTLKVNAFEKNILDADEIASRSPNVKIKETGLSLGDLINTKLFLFTFIAVGQIPYIKTTLSSKLLGDEKETIDLDSFLVINFQTSKKIYALLQSFIVESPKMFVKKFLKNINKNKSLCVYTILVPCYLVSNMRSVLEHLLPNVNQKIFYTEIQFYVKTAPLFKFIKHDFLLLNLLSGRNLYL